MKSIDVSSRIIKSVYFNPEGGQLMLCFKNGEERRFEGVPVAAVEEMAQSKSPGTYYIKEIRTKYRRAA